MIKKTVLILAAVMLVMFGASLSFADQQGGMASSSGPALPAAQVFHSVSPSGLGDALYYGYYNVRGNLNLFNIVNTDTVNGQKVRVVFRAGKDSQEVLDFAVCLSRGDVWTAYILDDGTHGRIFSADFNTVTAPAIPLAGQQFKVPSGLTADDTREGYFETIGFSRIAGYDSNVTNPVIANELECANWDGGTTPPDPAEDVPNVLMGNNTIFELATLATYSYNATAIADLRGASVDDPGPGAFRSIANLAATCDDIDWPLMKSMIISPYDIIAALLGETDVTMTFPTRRDCHNTPVSTDMFDGDQDASTPGIQYCTTIGIQVWDDDENDLSILDFSPATGLCLPYEVNVLHVGGSNIWNSTLSSSISVGSFELGWMAVSLDDINHDLDFLGIGSDIQFGLPVIAYTTQSFLGGTASYMVPTAHRTNINNVISP
jgi:hypothetical protein